MESQPENIWENFKKQVNKDKIDLINVFWQDLVIQNKDLSFCQITFCDRNLTPTEKQFVNSFKFN